MKKFALVFTLFFCTTCSYAQNLGLIDSIKTQLVHAKDQRRFTLLNDLAWEYRASYPDSTIYFATKAKSLAQELKLKKNLAKSINFIGIAYNNKGERLLAFQYYTEASKVSLDQDDSIQLAYSNINLGRLFFEQGLLSRSYEYYIKALPIFGQLKDSSGLSYTYQSLANLYKTQEDYVKAEKNYLHANEIRLTLGNTRDIMAAFIMTGRFYHASNQDDKAIQYLHRADSAGHIINDEVSLAEIKVDMASSYLVKGQLDLAEQMCAEGLSSLLHKENVLILPRALIVMGQIKFKKNNFRDAKPYFKDALRIALRTKDMTSKMDAYYWLWQLATKGSSTLETLNHYNQYLILKDSNKDLDLTRQVERFQFENEINRSEQENERLKSNNLTNRAIIEQQRLQNIILIIAVLFAVILGFVQWLNIKSRKNINHTLLNQNKELSLLNEEKDTLMSFVAHDLKAPMNRIQGLTHLLEHEESLTESQHVYIGMIKDATQAELDIIKDLLDAHKLESNIVPRYETVAVAEMLQKRVNVLMSTARLKNIQINLDLSHIENLKISTDEEYMNRILDNLISNAIKFSNREASIHITTAKTSSNFTVSIKDDGPGFSESDKLQLFQKFKKLSAQPTAGESSNGLGLAIVKTLVDRLNGNIELVSETGKGSEFSITFKL